MNPFCWALRASRKSASAPRFLGSGRLPIEDVLMRCCEGEIEPCYGKRHGISRPAMLCNREVIVAPGHHAKKAVDDRHGGLLVDAVSHQIDVNGLHVILGLGHEDQLIPVERDEPFFLGTGDLVMEADMEKARAIAHAEPTITFLLGFLGIAF